MKLCSTTLAALLLAGNADATVLTFNTDPFAGSTALTTPGRQIVGGEPSVTFDPATDALAFDAAVFNLSLPLTFANGPAASLPASGVNAIVLQEFPATFNAGLAANAIAAQITTPGAGLFIYFNTGLDLARLVYSTDLDDPTADLSILARFTNLSGQTGRDAFAGFSADNFQPLPEPSTILLSGIAALSLLAARRLQRS
ncbi:MAG: PEP-CTERM sorting domain-containing protein [Gammaproteobacteria bacterium]|nr:PEP-CTERM sorting domain-containing protein [Gammaproteobacteria bacterium]